MRVCVCQCLGRTGVYFIPTTTETCCPHCKRHTCQPVSDSITSHKDLKRHDSYTLIYTNKHTIFMIRQQMFFFFQLLITKVSFHVQEQHVFSSPCTDSVCNICPNSKSASTQLQWKTSKFWLCGHKQQNYLTLKEQTNYFWKCISYCWSFGWI